MPTQKQETPLSEFVKVTAVGQQVIGKVVRYFQTSNGPAVELAPVMIRNRNDGQGERFGSLALGLSTDLQRKVSASDLGKVLAVAHTGLRPSTKGSPTKLFQVFELDAADLAELRAGTLVLPLTEDKGSSATAPAAAGGETDDLPF